jgi:hypothetical protein
MSNATTLLTHGKATMVFRGGLGYGVVHLQSVNVTAGKLAQFAAALTVRYVEKGKRSTKGVCYTAPDFVILDGWVVLDLPSIFGEASAEGGMVVASAECRLIGDAGDIDAAIKASGATIVRDFRGHDAYGHKAA